MKIIDVTAAPAIPGTLAEKYSMEQCVCRSDEGKTLNYCRRKMNYDLPGKAAVLLFLHGAGERGNDNAKQLFHVASEAISWCGKNCQKVLMLFPQCPEKMQWVDTPWGELAHTIPAESEPMALAMAMLDHELASSEVDPGRVYIAGISMGGYGTWDALSRYPEKFAAAFPVCGGGDVAQAERMKDVPIFACHGEIDSVVPVSRTRDMVAAIKKVNGNIIYTEIPGCDHNSWTPIFGDDDSWKWLFAQKRSER